MSGKNQTTTGVKGAQPGTKGGAAVKATPAPTPAPTPAAQANGSQVESELNKELGATATPTPYPGATPAPGTLATPSPSVMVPVPNATPLPPRVLPKVGVILGPGGMKAYAHLGVLREMNRARIPVQSIVGLEWGAVIGAAYAAQGQINDAEWKAFKLRESELPESGFLSNKVAEASVSKLDSFLDAAFAGLTVEKARVEFACPSSFKGGAVASWFGKGSVKQVIQRCVPYAPLFQDNGGYLASPFSVEEAANYLRSRGANVILLVNVLGEGEYLPSKSAADNSPDNLLWSEIRRELYRAKAPLVNHVINVNTSGHPVTDFAGRRELMDAGQKAATDVLNKMVSQSGF